MLCLLLRFACIFPLMNHITMHKMSGAKYTPHMSLRLPWRNEAKGGGCSIGTGGSCGRYGGGVRPLGWRGCDFFGAGFGPYVCCCIGEGGKVVLYCLSVFFSWLGCMD